MMTSYQVSGMTCDGCTQIVHDRILEVAGVKMVSVDLAKAQATVEMEYPIPTETLQRVLANSPYELSEIGGISPADMRTMPPDEVTNRNKALISSYLMAVGRLDHAALHEYLHPDFIYTGPVKYSSAKDYIAMIKQHASSPVAEILLRYEIQAIFTDENDGCAIYDSVSRFPGKTVMFVEQIKIENGKILSTIVKFNRHQMRQLMQEVNNTKRSA